MDNETTQTTEDAGTEENTSLTTEPGKPRRRWRFDPTSRRLTMTEPNGSISHYEVGALPAAALDHVAQIGLTVLLGRADDADKAWDALASGIVSAPRPPAAPKINAWRQAIARAMVDAAKKAGAAISESEAVERAVALGKEAVNSLKTDAAVIKHWHKINGTQPAGVASLLAA